MKGKMVIVYDREKKSFIVYENGKEYQADSYWRLVQVIQKLHDPEDEIYWMKEG